MDKKPWIWMDDGQTLVENKGHRRVVLTTIMHERQPTLVTRGSDGVLTPLTRTHPVARMLEQSMRMAELLTLIEDGLKSGKVKAGPVMEFNPEAEECPVRCLEDVVAEVMKEVRGE
jgi:hypothetical protein